MPGLAYEQEMAAATGEWLVAGIDEAGRGALAGPVVAAAVILPLRDPQKLRQLTPLNDSKQLTARQRDRCYDLILAHAVAWGVGSVPADVIDAIGILPATRQAMIAAVRQLSPAPTCLLIDGPLPLRQLALPQRAIIRGDSHSLSIAAASILAKVSRDRAMQTLDSQYPLYGLAQHKGYGTPAHQAALAAHGPTPIHRHTFAPIRQPLF